jgi:hypothetical protein
MCTLAGNPELVTIHGDENQTDKKISPIIYMKVGYELAQASVGGRWWWERVRRDARLGRRRVDATSHLRVVRFMPWPHSAPLHIAYCNTYCFTEPDRLYSIHQCVHMYLSYFLRYSHCVLGS